MSVDLTGRWMRVGSCVDRPDLPCTTDTDRLRPVQVRAMSRVRGGCPVRNYCAAYATTADVTGGFWAGHDRDVLALRRLSSVGIPVEPALSGLGLAVASGRGRVA